VSTLRRHDLVWLDSRFDAGAFVASAEHAVFARNWVKQNRPLVVTRQPESQDTSQVALGFTLPPMRTRISLCIPGTAIIRNTRPLPLADTIAHAPASWREGMYQLLRLCEETCAVARVYGSLSSQIATAENYLDAASDLDLLIECNENTQLHILLAALEAFSSHTPRIDGEILMPTGWAVAWRELAAAIRTGTPHQVLAKSDRETRLIPVSQFFTSR
jgi:phosphoribosyl-dephospho-CoA transferase